MEKPPKEGKGAIAAKIVEAGISAIPFAGGPLAVLAELAEPYSRRRQRWLEQLAEVVTELERRVSELSAPVKQNDRFLTAALHANQIAMRTHQEEKLTALRNAVRNSALKSAPDDDLQLMFLRFVDDFTVSHIRVLQVFYTPEAELAASREMQVNVGGLAALIYRCVPQLNGQGHLCEQLCRDLENRGLIVQGTPLYMTTTPQGMLTQRTTDLGRQFLKFIS